MTNRVRNEQFCIRVKEERDVLHTVQGGKEGKEGRKEGKKEGRKEG